MESGIYQIRNIVNGKIYVGSAKNFIKRYKTHWGKLKGGWHPSLHMQASVNKYSIDNFVFEVLEECPVEKLIEREQYYIDILKPQYNKRLIAQSNLGLKTSEEAKIKGNKTRKETLAKRPESVLKIILNRYQPILCYKIDGSFYKEYESITAAATELGMHNGSISDIMRGKRLYGKGYIFKYKTSDNYSKQIDISYIAEKKKLGKEISINKNSKKIEIFIGNKSIGVFKNIRVAAKELKLSEDALYRIKGNKYNWTKKSNSKYFNYKIIEL